MAVFLGVDPFYYLCFTLVFVLSVPCSLEHLLRAEHLTLLCVMFSCVFVTLGSGVVLDCIHSMTLLCVRFSCVFVTFQYNVSGQMLYLIVSITDL